VQNLLPVKEQRSPRGQKPTRTTNQPSRREGDAGRPSRTSFSEERGADGRRKFTLSGPGANRPNRDSASPRFEKSDRPARGERSFDSRPPRDGDKPFNRGPKREFGDAPRGERSFDRGDKPFNRGPKREFGDAPRGERSFDRGDKPFNRGPKPEFGAGPKRGVRGDKAYWEKKQQRGKPRYKTAEDFAPSTDEMRLNRFLAHAGICSRRDADALIADGMVTVNGKIITEMGFKVGPTDDVRYAGERLKSERKVYVLLNKPKGFITTVDDEKARKTVMDLVANACKERIYPVGRLDRATTGVLLLTNDGALAKKLTHPSHGAKKIYQVTLDKPFEPGDMVKLKQGLTLEDGPVMVDRAELVKEDDLYTLGVELHVGRNRIVRRMFAHLGYEVVKLDRTSFGGLTKKSLERGHYRILNEKEISFLKML
jgi:23S rRNA pseudouridine2605 synthase